MIRRKLFDLTPYECEKGDLSRAYVYASNEDGIDKTTAHKSLLKAHEIAEHARILPIAAYLAPSGEELEGVKLCENVSLIYPDNWDFVDESSFFLMNHAMRTHCKADNEEDIGLKISTAAELLELRNEISFLLVAIALSEAEPEERPLTITPEDI